MSVQGDQVVYDYLSRVGDFAHGKLSPSRRATLVAELRARIETERAEAGAEEPDQVRLLLQRFGEPAAVVAEEIRRSPEHVVRRPERPSARALPPAAADRADTESTTMIPMSPGSAPDRNAMPGTAGQPWWKATDDDRDDDRAAGTDAGAPADVRPRPAAPTPPTPPLLPPPAEPPPMSPAAAAAQARPEIRVSPSEPDPPGRVGRIADGRSPLAAVSGTFLRRNLRELVAVVVLFVGGLLANLIVLLAGYMIALTSKVWQQSDKRFACIGVPLITTVTLGVMLWLRVTGRVGDRLGGDDIADLLRQYVSTLPRVVGLVAAVYLAWRLTRAARGSNVRGTTRR